MLLKFIFLTLNILSDTIFCLLWSLSYPAPALLCIEIDLMRSVHFNDPSGLFTDKSSNEVVLEGISDDFKKFDEVFLFHVTLFDGVFLFHVTLFDEVFLFHVTLFDEVFLLHVTLFDEVFLQMWC
ncbi:hypothetical protein AVEN_113590-1 [Araneus ventricosus]|uniref:Uncharacterized protein n=1 Tax=Araneus ventricosus TaxID=182803 RepID=A0A4Y2JGF0_ARAVE|nr:hypothetical protein AVEN_113590-1 [Araneus ventricosus]